MLKKDYDSLQAKYKLQSFHVKSLRESNIILKTFKIVQNDYLNGFKLNLNQIEQHFSRREQNPTKQVVNNQDALKNE